MVHAVIDTNVLVSSLLSRHPDTSTVVVMDYILSRKVTPLYNDDIIQEYAEVLHRAKFGFPANLVDAIVDTIKTIGLTIDRTVAAELLPDPKDLVFYEVALSKEDGWLVTGNKKHFPLNPIVVTPSEFLSTIGPL